MRALSTVLTLLNNVRCTLYIIYLVLMVFCFFLKLFFFFFQRQSDEFRLYVYKQLDIQELLEMKGVSEIQAIVAARGHHHSSRRMYRS